ncbi:MULTISPECIES: 7TM-DISM domain-containing protein [unclassified Desulfovibrio]|uniref:7TM-DISM domain-containing protein n=1 Tax=unclassified Desulfovibrio TaxID=2593640 RepID=UPI0013EA27FE|nr:MULTISPECIES: 7TM-DISM domain-containing protein [unclassified Desulfovibrio]
MALVVLLALLSLALPSLAADALLPEARPEVSARAETQAEAAAAPALAALQASRTPGARPQQAMLPVTGAGPNLSLLPYLDYLLDESGSLDIEEAAAPDRADAFAPLALEKLPRTEGVMWLRFTLAPLAAGERPATLLLDMGESIPGTPMLYEPERNDLSGALEWRESSPAQRNVLLLPEAGAEPLTCYIRLDGLPGPWFSPMVRTPADAATNWGSLARTGAILALGVVMLLCLLRGLSENGQWRVWTALYVAVALGQALLGMPDAGPHRSMLGHAAATMAPGIALMLLPHVGRHLMRTRQRARGLDIQLLLLSLPGAALALLPLVPGWAWLDRWLDLWPAGTLIFVPTALGAWLMGLGGARRFLLGCLLPPLFVAAGLLGLDFGIPPNLLASAPLWGTALSALLIAATGAPADMAAEAAAPKPRPADGKDADEGGIINLDHPLDDPNLRLVSGGKAPAGPQAQASGDGAGDPAPRDAGSAERARAEAREGALRAPLDDLLREGAALEQCALPPAVRQYAAAMLDAARRMADVLSHADAGEGGTSADGAPEAEGGEAGTAFDLQRLLREAHGAVAPAAEYAGIGLAWYMPPHLGQLYRGDAQTLGETLGLLLESAVRATRQGAVHLSARRVPESSDPGNILFTVTDTGSGAPPRERSSLALARAWELAARHGGYVGMEYGPNGTTIAFSLHLEPLEDSADDMQGASLAHVIIVADDPKQRRELSRMVADLSCRVSEAASEHEALRRHEADPAVLLVAQGRYALPAAADMVTRFMESAAEAGLSGCKVLAVTVDDSQWNLLADSGFTHAMLEPVDAEVLRQTVRDVMRGVRRSRPAPQKTAADADEAAAPSQTGAPESEGEAPQPEVAAPTAETADVEAAREAAPVPEAEAAQDTERTEAAPGDAGAAVAAPPPPESPAAPEEAEVSATAEAAAPAPEVGEGQAAGELSGEEWHFLLAEQAESAGAPEGQAPGGEPAAEPEEPATPGATESPAETGAAPEPAAEAPAPDILEEPEEAAAAPATDEPASSLMDYAVEAALAAESTPEGQGAAMPHAPSAPAAPDAEPAEAVDREAAPAQGHEAGERAAQDAAQVLAAEPPRHEPSRSDPARRPAAPVTAARASVYVSPALASPGEWVGEPMPIGTPVARREAPEAPETPRPGETRKEEARPAPSRPAHAVQPPRSGYTSPSVPVPGEWVGEPMPIPRKAPQPEPPAPEAAPATPGEAAPAAASAAASFEGDEGGSFMDFIVGATPVDAPEKPAPKAPGGVTDFVERSVSLVTSAVSSAFAPARNEADAPAPAEPAAPATADPVPQAGAPGTQGPDAQAPDPAILALVERLDAAMAQAVSAHAAGRGQMVAQAAAAIAEESESFGFRVLARMARCVERAGRAGDMNALRDLLPELEVSVERNRIALTQRR